MTLILALPNRLYSDRKISDVAGGEVCTPIQKSTFNDKIVAGFAGDFEKILALLKQVEEGETDPKQLALSKQDGLVIRNGRIYLLDAGYAWLKPKRCRYFATGSGGSCAMHFLTGRLSAKRGSKITHEDVMATFRYVAKSRSDCGDGVNWIDAHLV